MRWRIFKILLHKEVLRHLANRGGIALMLLFIMAAMLLSFFGVKDAGGGLTPGVRLCYVDYWTPTPLVAHLANHLPPELADHIQFRPAANATIDEKGILVYPQGTAAIQRDATRRGLPVSLLYPTLPSEPSRMNRCSITSHNP